MDSADQEGVEEHSDDYEEGDNQAQKQQQANTTDAHTRKTESKPGKRIKKKAREGVVMSILDTKYEVVRHVAVNMLGWKICKESIGSNNWDMYWTDSAIRSDHLARMQRFQRINHFPGMVCIHRKNNLARNLLRLRKRYPEEYSFFPETYLLPSDMGEFTAQFKGKLKTFIMKPEGAAQGRGIFLVQNPDQVPAGEHLIAQKYVTRPYLINNLKFDLRVYVLVAGCDPLRVFIYKEGLARFATAPYASPCKKNLANTFMHLTNYAINKHNPEFQENQVEMDGSIKTQELGHKQSMSYVLDQMRKQETDVDRLWKDIKMIAIKTLCAAQPQLAHSYKSGQPDDHYNHMCFEILGLDIIVTHEGKPMLLEVNHTPSFSTGSQLDFEVKSNLIRDTLQLMNISEQMRRKIQSKEKKQTEQRVLTGKRPKVHPHDRDSSIRNKQLERDAHIFANLGGFEEVYPSRAKFHDEDIESYLSAAQEEYLLATSGTIALKKSSTTPAEALTLSSSTPQQTFQRPMSPTVTFIEETNTKTASKLKSSESQERLMSSNVPNRTINLSDARVDLKDQNNAVLPSPNIKVFRMTDGFGKKTHMQVTKPYSGLQKFGLFKANRNSFTESASNTPNSGAKLSWRFDIQDTNQSYHQNKDQSLQPATPLLRSDPTQSAALHQAKMRNHKTHHSRHEQPERRARELVLNKIADSLNEVKHIIESLPNKSQGSSAIQPNKEILELARILELERAKDELASSELATDKSTPDHHRAAHLGERGPTLQAKKDQLQVAASMGKSRSANSVNFSPGFGQSWMGPFQPGLGASTAPGSAQSTPFQSIATQDSNSMSRAIAESLQQSQFTMNRTKGAQTFQTGNSKRPLAMFGYANKGMMHAAIKRGLTAQVHKRSFIGNPPPEIEPPKPPMKRVMLVLNPPIAMPRAINIMSIKSRREH